MPSSEPLHFTTQFKVSLYGCVVQNSETIDDSRWFAADHFKYPIRFKIQIILVRNRENDCVGILESLFNGGLDPQIV